MMSKTTGDISRLLENQIKTLADTQKIMGSTTAAYSSVLEARIEASLSAQELLRSLSMQEVALDELLKDVKETRNYFRGKFAF